MQDIKARWPDDAIVDSDATSKETLEDLEQNEKSTDSDSGKSPVPSPDGALHEPDEGKEAGPM
jgi:hypothetical protein